MVQDLTVLLTGATGLVGRFLLATLLRRRIPTIVLVRGQARRQAADRIEEALLAFEQDVRLPRPIVLESDLNKHDLGLSADAQELLRKTPIRILHSAASIRFHADPTLDNAQGAAIAASSTTAIPLSSEPYATNVQGTRNLLEMARQWDVRQFHHVSTAYVQCDRVSQRRAMEVAVADDASAGNDYERSKILSENMIRSATHVGPQTFYRPSIVVGDSQTGYTSTYHGFYAPLQIGAAFMSVNRLGAQTGDAFREMLGMRTSDTKNLVPVDWLASAIVQLMHDPAAIGEIYHLTHPQPARLVDMQHAIIDALKEHYSPQSGPAAGNYDSHLNPEIFRKQLAVYESYFANDPPFDRTHAIERLQNLPCPVMDYETLKKLARFALAKNFGWPRPGAPPRKTFDLQLIPSQGDTTHHRQHLKDALIQLEILGPADISETSHASVRFCRCRGQWQRHLDVNAELSCSTHAQVIRLVTTEQSLQQALIGKIAPEQLFSQGRWFIRGQLGQDWLEILCDWVQHVSMLDVSKQA